MRLPFEARYWAKVDKRGPVPPHRPELGPCWIWLAYCNPKGYGVIWYPPLRRIEHAQRIAFLLEHGRLPEPHGLHHCDNPSCCKARADERGAAHIFEGDNAANVADREAKGRGLLCIRRGEANGAAKLTAERVAEIRAAAGSQDEIARRFGIAQSHVSRILRGQSWRAS